MPLHTVTSMRPTVPFRVVSWYRVVCAVVVVDAVRMRGAQWLASTPSAYAGRLYTHLV